MSKKSKRAKKKLTGRRKQYQAASPRESSWVGSWWWIGGTVVASAVVGVVLWFTVGPGGSTEAEFPPVPEKPDERDGMYSEPPPMQIDTGKVYIATFETEKGDIVVELFADRAPNTVNSFVFLAQQGYYDGTTFHRVIPGFMAQGGDPTGTGGGGPGYTFPDEFHPDLKHDRAGILSMANAGANTNGSQFFITYAPAPYLDAYDEGGNLRDCARGDVSCHAVFGRVIEGRDVLESLTPRDPAEATAPGDLIKTIRIEER